VLGERHDAVEKLGAPTVCLGAVVQGEQERAHVGEARLDRLPPVGQRVHQAVTGHLGGHTVEEQLIRLGQEEAHWGHCRARMDVVIGRLRSGLALAPAGERPHLDRGLGVQGDPQHVVRRVRLCEHLSHPGEDGVGLGPFFWGRVVATVLST